MGVTTELRDGEDCGKGGRMLIVLGGVKGSGKDTVGDLLVSSYAFQKHSFAAPLKEMAAIAFPQLTHDMLWGSSSERERPMSDIMAPIDPRDGSPLVRDGDEYIAADGQRYPVQLTARHILQTLGTEWGRRMKDDIWIKAALIRTYQAARNCVITDQRFINEAVASREFGGITVKLLRGLEDAKRQAKYTEPHQSEAELLEIADSYYDFVLDNTGSLIDVPLMVDCMLKMIRAKDIPCDGSTTRHISMFRGNVMVDVVRHGV